VCVPASGANIAARQVTKCVAEIRAKLTKIRLHDNIWFSVSPSSFWWFWTLFLVCWFNFRCFRLIFEALRCCETLARLREQRQKGKSESLSPGSTNRCRHPLAAWKPSLFDTTQPPSVVFASSIWVSLLSLPCPRSFKMRPSIRSILWIQPLLHFAAAITVDSTSKCSFPNSGDPSVSLTCP